MLGKLTCINYYFVVVQWTVNSQFNVFFFFFFFFFFVLFFYYLFNVLAIFS